MRLPRRRTFWLSAALLLVIVLGAWLLVPQSRITQANCDKIKEGMSQEEVELILGHPPGNYTAWPHPRPIEQLAALASQGGDDGIVTRIWLSEEGAIKVVFDPRARVISAEFFRRDSLGTGSFESRSERFMNWLHERVR